MNPSWDDEEDESVLLNVDNSNPQKQNYELPNTNEQLKDIESIKNFYN